MEVLNCFVANFLLLLTFCHSSIVENNLGLEVANGRIEYVRRAVLSFRNEPGKICKVQVVQNEPMYQRVGTFTPEVSDWARTCKKTVEVVATHT